MSAKTERNCLILRVDSQYCSTLPQNLEILKIHSQESPRPRSLKFFIQDCVIKDAKYSVKSYYENFANRKFTKLSNWPATTKGKLIENGYNF